MDATPTDWKLSDYVKKGIEMLGTDNGFFMMAESGKIDWACHANDSNAAVSEVLALDDAVKTAMEFYQKHPNETLILVTGDHETGGMSLGYANMEYTLYPQYLQKQTMSFTHFNDTYIVDYKANKPTFDAVLKDVQKVFGIIAPQNATEASDKNLIMSNAELQKLKTGVQSDASEQIESERVWQLRTADDHRQRDSKPSHRHRVQHILPYGGALARLCDRRRIAGIRRVISEHADMPEAV